MKGPLRPVFLALLVATLLASASAQHLVATVTTGGNPLNVAVDPTTKMIYVSNPTANSVDVINSTTNTLVTSVTVGNAPSAIWVNLDADLIYAYNQGDATVSVINGATNTVSGTIGVQFSINAAAVLGLSHFLYIADTTNGQVHVIDLSDFADTADISVSPAPVYIAANPAAKLVYVSDGVDSTITVISTATNAVTGTFNPGAGLNVTSLSADGTNNVLYAATAATGSQASVTAMNATTGAILGTTVPLGTINQILALPTVKKAVVSGGKQQGKYTHTLLFIDSSTFKVSPVVGVGNQPVGLGFNPFTRTIYTADYFSGSLAVVGD